MRSLILYYKLLLIIAISFNFIYCEVLKPINKKVEIVKIKDENKKTRTYYHLNKNDELVFGEFENYVEDKNASYNETIEINLNELKEPVVACPNDPDNDVDSDGICGNQ